MLRRDLIRALTSATALPAAPRMVAAQERYPSRPITITVGFTAGGNGDTVTRFVANAARERLGVPVIVENRPGAGGTLAAERLARARPDGYSLALATSSPFTVEPNTRQVPFDATKDFTYLVQFLVTPHCAYVLTGSRFRTWDDVIAYARANPDGLRWGGPGRGGPFMAAEAAFRKLGLSTIYVPYGGGADAITALLGEQIDMVVSSDFPPLLDAGQVRLLAEIGPTRMPGMEAVPAFGELGYPLALQIFLGLAAPAGLPPEVIATWERTTREIMATDGWSQLMTRIRAVSAFLPQQEFQRRVLENHRDIGVLVRDLGLRT
jgi:tripartite-type tricarboxylate transporter receptor subunit TctC